MIRENIRKGFLETQSKVNSWVTNLKKKIDGEGDDDYQAPPPRTAPQGYYAGPPQQPYGIRRSGELGRRSGDRERYDADPQLIGDDFATLQLKDEEGIILCCIDIRCTDQACQERNVAQTDPLQIQTSLNQPQPHRNLITAACPSKMVHLKRLATFIAHHPTQLDLLQLPESKANGNHCPRSIQAR